MMKTTSANRTTKMKVIENGTVVKTVANASINYGQDLLQLKKMIELAIRLSPQDPIYTVEKVCVEIGDGKYSEIDQNELVQIQNSLFKVDPSSATSLGTKVSLKVSSILILSLYSCALSLTVTTCLDNRCMLLDLLVHPITEL